MSASEEKALAEKIEKQGKQIELLEDKLEKALAENERLRKELEEALRSLKRQAAPFSKNQPKADPKPPGRKSGHQYGARGSRPVPTRINETHHAPLPRGCLHCGGRVEYRETKPQFQEEIVRHDHSCASMSISASVANAGGRCKGVTRCRPPMR